ncbi:hypothetical protein [Armatimonas sp.]|uniref:hypothetical protein n=1 Tax=Armatimonas sp. TaxID=1872638 RepID=UPI00286A9F1B|nr:hypothetical protein [Armatimonas sp.]
MSDSRGATEMEWETKTDPVEESFTIELPKGWKNDAYMKRKGIITVPIATSESPDGAAALFFGDPKLPTFIEPQAMLPHQHNDPNVKGQTYTPAERFLPTYLKSRFAKVPGFQIIGVTQEPELVEKNRAMAEKQGVFLSRLDSARVDFTFRDGDKTRHGAIYSTTFSVGTIWMASVAGIVSNDEPQNLKTALFHIMESQKTAPAWKEKEKQAAADRQRQHEYIMAQIARNTEQLRVNHQNNMANLNGMAVRHQARMDAIHAAGDASMAAYKARDAASDNNHRGFLNYINEENTVAGPSGRTFQVENKYERYYINKNDNSYIGLKGGTTLNELNGINPGDYEEAKVLR